jgi:hypothetical protein
MLFREIQLIWGSHSGVVQDVCLLGRKTLSLGERFRKVECHSPDDKVSHSKIPDFL